LQPNRFLLKMLGSVLKADFACALRTQNQLFSGILKHALAISLGLGVGLWEPQYLSANPMQPGLEQQAQAAQQAGDYGKAIALWQQVIQQSPKSAVAYYNLGLNYHYAIDLEKAIAAYQEALRLNPQYDSAYINLGLLQLQIGKAMEAEQLFRKVLTLPDRYETPASSHTIAYYNLAVILSRTEKRQEALKFVQNALALTPDFVPAQTLLKQLR
jgi:tetratricopeptide (TPR) repeat protein